MAASDRPTVLLPVRVLQGESLPEGTPELLANAHVVLLGYHLIPDQTATDQAREQFGDRAMDKLDEFADTLSRAGADVDVRLVFTHEDQATIDRVIYEEDCLAVLVPNAIADLESVLVAIRGGVTLDRIARLTAGLFADTDVEVVLYHVRGESEDDADVETLLDDVLTRLVDYGLSPSSIDTIIDAASEPMAKLSDRAESYDAVVMGETDPSVTTFVFGMPSDQIAERFLGPVLVVQRPRPDENSE
ncbi:universal stress protein [Halopenitus sp. H-Gu1]|uniref:universal stress protein n=1 Tax=Halopenitus sp. H-Gu1 TaxID=3242697 RepID=UPI00359EA69F